MNLRHLVLLSVAALGLAVGNASAQSTGDYRSSASGPWGTATNWERFNGSAWVVAPSAPVSTDNVITVRTGHTMTIAANVTVDQVVIETGATVDANTNNRTLTIADGTGIDMDVTGVLKLTHNGAAITVSAGAELKVESGGLYQHGQNNGTVPTATWADGSTCEVNGNGTSAGAIGNLGQSFYNLTWNMTGAGGGGSKNAYDLVDIRNDFMILQISGGSLEFAQTEAHERIIAIGGDFIVSHPVGKVTLNQGPADMVIGVGGDFIQDDAGLFELSGGNGTGSMNLDGDFTQSGGEFTELVPDVCWLRFVGTTDQTAYTYDVEKMTNSINVEVDKSGGRVLLASNFRVNGDAILRMTQGNILTYNYILTLGQTPTSRGTLEWTNGTIVGFFRRWYDNAVAANVLYPIGSEVWHRPATLSFTGAPSSGGTVTGSWHDGDPGTFGLPLNENGDTYNSVCPDGYWRMTSGDGIAGGTYTLDLQATGFGCVTDPSTIAILKRADGLSAWYLDGTDVPGTGTISVPIAHRSGMQGFSEFGITSGGDDTPLPIELAEFRISSTNGAVNLFWRTGAEVNNEGFEVQRAAQDDEDFQTIASYRTHGELLGLGTSYIGKSYGFNDDGSYGALVTGATYRYRLIDVGIDGSRTTHPERSVVIEGRNVVTPGMTKLALGGLSPNPARDLLNIEIMVAEQTPVTIQVFAVDGTVVDVPVAAVQYAEGTHPLSIDTRGLRPGAYSLRMLTAQGIRSQRFLIVR